MNENINFEILSESIQDSLIETLKDKNIAELKALDWFSWETDFFIEEQKALFNNAA